MEQPLIDPPTPYLGRINGGFTTGKMVRIQGYVSPVGDRIDFNFQTSENIEPRDDIGLHLSIRLTEGYIARNSLQGGVWGEEQGHGNLPIQAGEKFEVIVLSGGSEYKIAVNGKHYCEFPHRILTSSITHLSIEGDVSLSLISFEIVPLNTGPAMSASAPPRDQSFGPPPNQSFGPSSNQSFGQQPDQSFGPRPDSFGPGNYGNQGSYGPPPGQYSEPGYAPPPPPPGQEKESGFESFLESAAPLIAGAISSGVAANLLSSITGGGAQNQQPQQNQQSYGPPPQQPQQQQQQSGAPDVLGGLGSLLSSFTGQQNQPQQQQYQQQPQSGGQEGVLGSLLSSFASRPLQPTQQPAGFNPSQVGGQGSVGGMGSVGSLLTSLAGQVLSPQHPQQRDQGH